MPIETMPMLDNAFSIVEDEYCYPSLLQRLTKALESVGCVTLSYDGCVRYVYYGAIVAIEKSWRDGPDYEYCDIRLDIDKDFALKHRARLIEFMLPDYAKEYIDDYGGISEDVIVVSSKRHMQLVLQCLGDVQSVFTDAK